MKTLRTLVIVILTGTQILSGANLSFAGPISSLEDPNSSVPMPVTKNPLSDSDHVETPLSSVPTTLGFLSAGPLSEVDKASVLPEGWTYAASNSDFAFHEKTEELNPGTPFAKTKRTLQMMHVSSGVIRDLAGDEFDDWGNQKARLGSHYDVSPDGTTVIFGLDRFSESSGRLISRLYFERVADPSVRKIVERAERTLLPDAMVFGPDGTVSLTGNSVFPDETRIEYSYQVNLSTFDVGEPVYRILQQGTDLHVDPDTPLIVLPVKVDLASLYPPDHRLYIFDASAGGDALRLLDVVSVANAGYDSSYLFVDAYTVPSSGRRVVTYSLAVGTFQKITQFGILDPFSKQTLNFSGHAYDLSYEGDFLYFTIEDNPDPMHPENPPAVRNEIVDLKSFTLLTQPPEGWRRAGSNPYYAFRVDQRRAGSSYVYILQLMNLKTGGISDIATQTVETVYYPAGRFLDVYDISPDGTTVVYGTAERSGPKAAEQFKTYIIKLNNPSLKRILGGALQGAYFNDDGTMEVVTDLYKKNAAPETVEYTDYTLLNFRTLKLLKITRANPDKFVTDVFIYDPVSQKQIEWHSYDLSTGNIVKKRFYHPTTGKLIRQEIYDAVTEILIDLLVYNPASGVLVYEKTFDPKTGKLLRHDVYDASGRIVTRNEYDPATGKRIRWTVYQYDRFTKKLSKHETYDGASGKLIRSGFYNPATGRIIWEKHFSPKTGKMFQWDFFDYYGKLLYTIYYNPVTGGFLRIVFPK